MDGRRVVIIMNAGCEEMPEEILESTERALETAEVPLESPMTLSGTTNVRDTSHGHLARRQTVDEFPSEESGKQRERTVARSVEEEQKELQRKVGNAISSLQGVLKVFVRQMDENAKAVRAVEFVVQRSSDARRGQQLLTEAHHDANEEGTYLEESSSHAAEHASLPVSSCPSAREGVGNPPNASRPKIGGTQARSADPVMDYYRPQDAYKIYSKSLETVRVKRPGESLFLLPERHGGGCVKTFRCARVCIAGSCPVPSVDRHWQFSKMWHQRTLMRALTSYGTYCKHVFATRTISGV